MCNSQFESNWEQMKSVMMEAEPHLTEEDFQYDPSAGNEFIAHIASKINKSFEDTKGWIDSVLFSSHKAS